jgi:hypothetical protein
MNNRIDDLLATAADDGASALSGVCTSRSKADVEQLMQAWCIERQNNIECSIFLDQASQLLLSILHDGEISDRNRRKSRSLLRVIREAQQRQGRTLES